MSSQRNEKNQENMVPKKQRAESVIKIELSKLLTILRVQEDENEKCVGLNDTELHIVPGEPFQWSSKTRFLVPQTRIRV